jgi:hypothetical protein
MDTEITIKEGDRTVGVIRRENGVYSAELTDFTGSYPLPLFGLERETRPSHERVADWIKSRVIPPNRDGISELLKSEGLTEYSYWKLLGLNHGRTTDDPFQLEIPGVTQARAFKVNDPPLYAPATSGKLEKRYLSALNIFIKMSGYNADTGAWEHESVSEVVASELCGCLGLCGGEYVRYELCETLTDVGRGGHVAACRCDGFITSRRQQFIPIGALSILDADGLLIQNDAQGQYAKLVAALEVEYGVKNAKRSLDRMLFVDFIIMNTDRHLDNFGLICEGGGFRMAPMFDFGAGFLGSKQLEHADMSYLRSLKAKPFNVNFDEQLSLIEPDSVKDLNLDCAEIHGLVDSLAQGGAINAAKADKINEIMEHQLKLAKAYLKI